MENKIIYLYGQKFEKKTRKQIALYLFAIMQPLFQQPVINKLQVFHLSTFHFVIE